MSTRLTLFVLGLVAVSALVFQPICEAAEARLSHAHSAPHAAAAGGDEGDFCCSTVAPDALPTAAPLALGSSILVAAPAGGPPVFRPHVVIRDALPALAPPPILRYYVRSARIQR
jgi:hypothetical protein